MSTQRLRQPHHSPKIVNESIRSLVQRIPSRLLKKGVHVPEYAVQFVEALVLLE